MKKKIKNKTDRDCNPSLLDIVEHKPIPLTNGTTTPLTPTQYKGRALDTASIVSLILWFLIVLYSSFTSASKGGKLINIGGSREKTSLTDSDRK